MGKCPPDNPSTCCEIVRHRRPLGTPDFPTDQSTGGFPMGNFQPAFRWWLFGLPCHGIRCCPICRSTERNPRGKASPRAGSQIARGPEVQGLGECSVHRFSGRLQPRLGAVLRSGDRSCSECEGQGHWARCAELLLPLGRGYLSIGAFRWHRGICELALRQATRTPSNTSPLGRGHDAQALRDPA